MADVGEPVLLRDRVFARGKLADVILRYTFQAAGLEDEALSAMLLLVLSGADQGRRELLPESPRSG